MTAITRSNLKKSVSSDWIKKEKESYTSDEVINAYLQGEKDGQSAKEKVLIQKLEENLKLAQKIVENINEEMVKSNFTSIRSYLRIKSLFRFDAVFSINKDDYLSTGFDAIYKLSRDFKSACNNDSFNINTTFMPITDSLNEERLVSDGFYFTYEKRK